jgi:ABC-type spermidine/putrescine transport system permease subunit II
MIAPLVMIYLAVALVVLVAGLDDNARQRRCGLPEMTLSFVLVHAALWLPLVVMALMLVTVDAVRSR